MTFLRRSKEAMGDIQGAVSDKILKNLPPGAANAIDSGKALYSDVLKRKGIHEAIGDRLA